SNLTRDLYQVMINPAATNERMLLISRVSGVIITLLGTGAAAFITNINDAYRWAMMVNGVFLVFLFLAIMFWRRVTRQGVVSIRLASFVFILVYPLLGLPFDQALAGYVFSLAVLVAASLMTQHDESEVIRTAMKHRLVKDIQDVEAKE